MFYTYVLRCFNTKTGRRKFYVGSTEDLIERIKDHKSKSVETTKSFDSLELVYYEACLDKKDTLTREKKLKTGFGRGYINRRLANYLKMRD